MTKIKFRFIVFFFCWAVSLNGLAYSGNFQQRVEFLYFKPSMDQSYYAISSSDNTFTVDDNENFFPNGKRFNNDPSFQPAFRLEEIFCFCSGNALDFRFAYFSSCHTNSVSGPFLFDTVGFPGDGAQRPEDTSYNGTARYKEQFNYYGVDGTFNRLTLNCFQESLFFLFGLHFAYLNSGERASSRGTSINDEMTVAVANRFKRNSHFWGLGPQFGLDYRYFLPYCPCCEKNLLSIRANARVALLASYTWADLHYFSSQTGPQGVNLDNQPLWRINPCADVKVGLSCEHAFRCWNMTFEIGYEFIWYSNAIDSITGYDVAYAGDSLDLFSNFNLQGPYFAVGVVF